jgi:segregation and condensation protein B
MELKDIAITIEAILLAAGEPISMKQLQGIFEEEALSREEIASAIAYLQQTYHEAQRAFILKEVANGYSFQLKSTYAQWISRLWEEKPPRYSRAFLETLAIIAYRQPVSRGDIEAIRGVAVSSQIIKSLLDREWIKILGYRDAPGKPAILGTTKKFLDYFNLQKITDLPALTDIKNLEQLALTFSNVIEETQQTRHVESTDA